MEPKGMKLDALVEWRIDGALLKAARRALCSIGHDGADCLMKESDRPETSDYQFNCAFPLAKASGVSPLKKAAELADALSVELSGIADVFVAGAGFVNVRLSDGVLLSGVDRALSGGFFPKVVGASVLVDHSSPNCAKSMHAGHLRSTVIGDAISRIAQSCGVSVTRVNHLGDWGTPFGMMAVEASDAGIDVGSLDIGGLESLYKEASKKFAADPAGSFALRARQATAAMQRGEEPEIGVWRKIRDVSLNSMDRAYEMLGIGLDRSHVKGESFYKDLVGPVVKGLLDDGVASDSDGAVCFFPADGKAPLMLVKSEQAGGGFLYGATDAAALKTRSEEGFDEIVYVVDERQGPHFSALFELGEKAGWTKSSKPVHAGFGVMTDATGKPFKTRDGEAVPLSFLVEEAIARGVALCRKKAPEASEAEVLEMGAMTGVGALKYFDLSRPRRGAVRFDLDAMASMDGNTAPYLQYARARASSIMQRAQGVLKVSTQERMNPEERALALSLCRVGVGVSEALAGHLPHLLCDRLYALAKDFSVFYETCPAVFDGIAQTRRIALCQGVDEALESGLSALGIASPKAMPRAEQRPAQRSGPV